MELDSKINKILLNYVLEYYKRAQNTKEPKQLKNMWNEITTKINQMLEIKHKLHTGDSSGLLPTVFKTNEIEIYFERHLLFQLKNKIYNLTEDEIFFIAYPHLHVLKRVEIIFVNHDKDLFDIDKETLEKLNTIINYRLNRYTFESKVWRTFEDLFRMGVRLLEINVGNPIFRLTPKEKRKLTQESLIDKKRTRKSSRIIIHGVEDRINSLNVTYDVESISIVSDPLMDRSEIETTDLVANVDDQAEKSKGVSPVLSTISNESGSSPETVISVENGAHNSIDIFSLEIPNSTEAELPERAMIEKEIQGTSSTTTQSKHGEIHCDYNDGALQEATDVTPENVNTIANPAESSHDTDIINVMNRANKSTDIFSLETQIYHEWELPAYATQHEITTTRTSTQSSNEEIQWDHNNSSVQSSMDVEPIEQESLGNDSIEMPQPHHKQQKVQSLVPWSLLFVLYDKDVI